MDTYYDLLGVPPTADHVTIKEAYRSRIKRAHPDAGGSAREAVALTEAYHVLADGDTRAAYDAALVKPGLALGARVVRVGMAIALTAGYLASAFR